MRALRLPARRIPGRLLASLPRSTPILRRSCSLRQRSRAVEDPIRARAFLTGRPGAGVSPRWTPSGISQVSQAIHSRASAPVRDPGRTDVSLTMTATSMLPPLNPTTKAPASLISGLTTQLRHPLPYASRVALPPSWKARCFRWPVGLRREGLNPRIALKGFRTSCSFSSPELSCRKGGLRQRAVRRAQAGVGVLSRYTHRIAISNRRLLSADENGVTFKYKDYRIEGPARYKAMTSATDEFIRALLLIHVLPKGFHRIRHYGLLPTAPEPQTLRTRASCSLSRRALKNPRRPKPRSTNPACCRVHARAAAVA